MLPVPLLTPRLSAHWVNVVTPVPRAIAAPLVDSLIHEVVCREQDILHYVPDQPEGRIGYDRAVALALTRINNGDVETRWSDATGTAASADPLPSDPQWAGGTVYLDEREQACRADADALWSVVTGIGGERGWYSFPLAWSVRGWLDRLVGGRRAAPRPARPGPAAHRRRLDWWRVERLDDDARTVTGKNGTGENGTGDVRLLRLRAEMKVPGRAWLEMTVAPDAAAGSRYRQRAVFLPARPRRPPVLVGRRTRSTAWCSAAWSATSPAPPSGASTALRPHTTSVRREVTRNRRTVPGGDCRPVGRAH